MLSALPLSVLGCGHVCSLHLQNVESKSNLFPFLPPSQSCNDVRTNFAHEDFPGNPCGQRETEQISHFPKCVKTSWLDYEGLCITYHGLLYIISNLPKWTITTLKGFRIGACMQEISMVSKLTLGLKHPVATFAFGLCMWQGPELCITFCI